MLAHRNIQRRLMTELILLMMAKLAIESESRATTRCDKSDKSDCDGTVNMRNVAKKAYYL